MARRILPLLFAVLLAGCWEQPVVEVLTLSFNAGGDAQAQLEVELRQGENVSEAVEERLAELEEALLAGDDEWRRRFGEMESVEEDFYWRRRGGKLIFAARSALVDDPTQLGALLADSGTQLSYSEGDGFTELAIYPGLAYRATRRERRRMQGAVEEWSAALEAYFQATAALYDHLATRPERAGPCFAHLFEDGEELGPSMALEDDEKALVEALFEGISTVLSVLEVDRDEARSLDELSRLVYDPFPARIRIEVPGTLLEVEGFRGAGGEGGALEIPGLGLWAAFEALEGRWIAPDPALIYLEAARAEEPPDVGAIARLPRRVVDVPSEVEVREALREALEAAEVYRVRWGR
jgi:hypothetical protein